MAVITCIEYLNGHMIVNYLKYTWLYMALCEATIPRKSLGDAYNF